MEELDADSDSTCSSKNDQRLTGLDVTIGNILGVTLYKDGLIARRSSRRNGEVAGRCPNVTLLASRPCQPSTFSIVYYFEMVVTCSSSHHDQETEDRPADVAIGFSIQESWAHSKLLGTYPCSCAYLPLQGKVIYFNKETHSQVHRQCSEPYEMESRDYVVGAGFHPCSGTIFFTFCGKVVSCLKEPIFNQRRLESVFPAISILSYGAQVELYFGPSCKHFELEPIPTCLDGASGLYRELTLSNGNRSLLYSPKQKGTHDRIRAIMADKPAPVRSAPFFYFEIRIEKESSRAQRSDMLALGFSRTESFCSDNLPGYYENSCGLILNEGKARICCNGVHIQKSFSQDYASVAARRYSSPVRAHDYIGAGIHYGTEEIFFVKNGKFMGALSNKLRGTLRPVVALSGTTARRITYGGLEYKHWVNKPSRILSSHEDNLHKNSMKYQELTVHHSAYFSPRNLPSNAPPRKHPPAHQVESFRANDVAPLFSLRLDVYYFEATVEDNVDNGCIAIGFSHYRHFNCKLLPGSYPFSIGYHGDSDKLRSSTKHCKYGPTLLAGDSIGAGINHPANTIFFVKNAQIVERVPLHELRSCALYPVIGLGTHLAEVRVNLGKQPFLCQAC